MASRALRRRSTYRAINSHKKDKPRPLLRLALVAFVLITMLTSGASAATLLLYGNNLPSLKNFESRFDFQNTRILDDHGHKLYDLADLSRGRGRRVVEPLIAPLHPTSYYRQNHQDWLVGTDAHYGIPPALQDATIATEDATFYSNPGFDPLSILRAEYDNLTKGHVVSGASTITQQLIKKYLLTDDPSISRKIEEIVLAAELTQKYPKTEILWYYLNSVPYGNLSIGAQAAAQTYFHVNVWQLDPAQCAFLAGLPEAPSTYNPIGNLPAALNRMSYVLHLMYLHGYLVDANGRPDPSLETKYLAEARKWPKFEPPKTNTKFPQFVAYAVDQLQHLPGLQDKIYSGLDVYTTIDSAAQKQAQDIVSGQIASLGSYNVSDGALVSMDLRSNCYGCIRAMVGSADYNAPGGQINMANTPRQPGSSFKPFNYIYAFEHGLGPATWVDDDPISIPDVGNPEDGGVYSPTDYDHQWHGTVSLRVALQNSLNVPAVKVEQYDASVGGSIYNTVRAQAIKQGIVSFGKDNPTCCGWALTLGGMPRGVRLVEETAAYGAFATGGHYVQPIAITKVVDRSTGKVLYDAKSAMQQAFSNQVIKAPYAYVMNNVLSDDASRCTPQVCEFGIGSDLAIPGWPVAAKTGTTNSFTDNWTVGYTPQIVTGVWVGNADNSPMVGTTGITGAAPIWHQYMVYALQHFNLQPVPFKQPTWGVYYGSACQLPTGSGTIVSSFNYDLWAITDPLCSVGGAVGSVTQSVPSQQSAPPAYSPPAAVTPTTAPPAVAPPPAPATTPVTQQAPPQAPTAQSPPATQPTAVVLAPTQAAPPVTQPTSAAPAPVTQPTP
jgi:membrane peptidoglycan carboxypeptidase